MVLKLFQVHVSSLRLHCKLSWHKIIINFARHARLPYSLPCNSLLVTTIILNSPFIMIFDRHCATRSTPHTAMCGVMEY